MAFRTKKNIAEYYKNNSKLIQRKNRITNEMDMNGRVNSSFDTVSLIDLNTEYNPENKADTFIEKVNRDVNLVGDFMGSFDGSSFIAKQEGLQLSNPNLYRNSTNKIYNPASILMATSVSYTGLKPKRHGIELYSDSNYDSFIKNLNARGQNRLLDLNTEIIKNESKMEGMPIETLSGITGPNTLYGIGRTEITLKHSTPKLTESQLQPYLTVTNDAIRNPKNEELGSNFEVEELEITLFGSLYEDEEEIKTKISNEVNFPITTNDELGSVNRYAVLSHNKLEKDSEFTDFRHEINKPEITGKGYDYNNNIVTRFGMIDAGKQNDKSDITRSELFDKINILNENEDSDIEDFIKFKFVDANNSSKFIVFRSTFSSINDDITPSWDSSQLLGRPDSVYRYISFERTVSVDFVVPTYSRNELISNYRRLNELARYTLPKFNYDDNKGFGSPFIRLTLGDYFKNSLGFLSSLNFQVDDASPWEINLEKDDEIGQLPHNVNVTFNFTHIMDNVPNNESTNFFSILNNVV